MTREQIEELLALDSLGLLEAEEKRALETELANDPALRAELDALHEIAALLPFAAKLHAPSPGLKHRILQEVENRKLVHTPAAKTPWFPWAIAAVLAILAAGLGWEVRNARLERDVAERMFAAAQAEPLDLRLAPLQSTTPNSPAAGAVAWSQKNGSGILVVNRLAPLAPDRCYQIWIVDPARKDPVSGGIFNVRPDGSAQTDVKPAQAVTAADKFVISLERAGGVPKAEGPFVLAGS